MAGRVARLRVRAQLRLDGAVYASPLVVPTTAGRTVVVATEGGSVYGVRDDALVWRLHVGAPVPRSQLPCGNIDPLGITGTPVYDPTSALVYVVTELADPVRHELVALDPAAGSEAWRTPIDTPGATPVAEQQRGALALSGGRVWVPMGGLYGDCGPYIGKVIGVPTGAGPPSARAHVVYQVPTSRTGGIWAAPGPAVTEDGSLYVAVGNGAATAEPYDGSDAVLQLSSKGRLLSRFTPRGWQSDNAADLDLGSMGPLPVPGGMIIQAGKRGVVYLLRQGELGAVGGELATTTGCTAFGGGAVTDDPAGALAVLPCGEGATAYRVSGDRIEQAWRVVRPAISGSPVVVGSTVLAIDPQGGRLAALDAGSGAIRMTLDVGPLSRFATPAVSGDTAYLGTMRGLVVVALT